MTELTLQRDPGGGIRARGKAICCQGTAAGPLRPTDMGVCRALPLAV